MNMNRKLSAMTAIMAIALLATPVLAKQGEGMQSASPERQKMHAEMTKENKNAREQIRKLEAEAESIVRAPQFDKDAFIAKHMEIESLRAKMAETRVKAKADMFAKMSVEERVKMRDEFKNRHNHRKGKFPQGGRGQGPEESSSKAE